MVEIEVVADSEDDDVLRFLTRRQPRTVEGRRWLAKQLGTAEMQMKTHEMEDFDEVVDTFLRTLSPEQRLAGLAPEQVLSAYAPEQRLAGLAPEQRLAGLVPEQVVLTLPDDVLRALSPSYIDTLAEPTRTIIRKRIGR